MDAPTSPSATVPSVAVASDLRPLPRVTHKCTRIFENSVLIFASTAASNSERKAYMAKDDLASVEGKVTTLTGGGVYQIMLDNGLSISAKLCGKMKRFRIKVVAGDRVTIGVSPYDVAHGLILHRHK